MISEIKILYGLANRCRSYGLKNSKSYSGDNPLSEILEICDGIDGAEKYGWDNSDLEFLKNNSKPTTIFSKIDFSIYELDQIINLVLKHQNLEKNIYLEGIFMHNKVDDLSIEKYQKLSKSLKSIFDIKLGFSV